MFAYCLNNPGNRKDTTGELPTWFISGLIGMATNVTSAYIAGERGEDLLDDALFGFLSGCCKPINIIYSVYSAYKAGRDYTELTDNEMVGFIIGLMSFGTSLFSGDNISKLPGVNEMDDAAILLFDAVFAYGANVFNATATNDIASYAMEGNSSDSRNAQSCCITTRYHNASMMHRQSLVLCQTGG